MIRGGGHMRWMRRWVVAAGVAAGGLGGTAAQAQIDISNAYDTSLPIEITADTLEVEQESQIAIFRGNVDAVQGTLSLRADLLKVYYRTDEDGNNSISKIEAEDNVLISSPTETAQGDRGVYDIDSEKMHLFGSVVLTRGQNVIKGDRMELDLATGKSKVESASVATGGQGRVKALFVPNSEAQ